MRQALTIERSWWQQRRHGACWHVRTRAIKTQRGWNLHAIADRYGSETGKIHRDLYEVAPEPAIEFGEPRTRLRALLVGVLKLVRMFERTHAAGSYVNTPTTPAGPS